MSFCIYFYINPFHAQDVGNRFTSPSTLILIYTPTKMKVAVSITCPSGVLNSSRKYIAMWWPNLAEMRRRWVEMRRGRMDEKVGEDEQREDG